MSGFLAGCATTGQPPAPVVDWRDTRTSAATQTAKKSAIPPSFMKFENKTMDAPRAFYAFCERAPTDDPCRGTSLKNERIEMDAAMLELFQKENWTINHTYTPRADYERYQLTDVWDYPLKDADCEDYALAKLKELLKYGFPASSLLIAVVLDENREGHAILIARTTGGDYVFDNRTDDVKLWSATPYTFVMAQSPFEKKIWRSLGHASPATGFMPLPDPPAPAAAPG